MAAREPACVLLLPRALDAFVLAEQARALLREPGVLAVEPPRAGYGSVLRLPPVLAAALATRQAKRLVRRLRRDGHQPAAVVAFHAVHEPLARALVALTGAELWYWRWDRYEAAPDAGEARRARLRDLHESLAAAADLVVASSVRLAELEAEAGREPALVALTADGFPAPEPAPGVVALSLGHLGRRTDWALLRALGERMPDLQLLLVGDLHAEETPGDEDLAWCRAHPPFVFLGRQDDAATAELLRLTDCGLLPFRVDDFNDAGLPFRILKAARLGRRTVCADLAGVRTWDRAVRTAPDLDAWEAALRAEAGTRAAPDAALRAWALQQTAEAAAAPLLARLGRLGVAVGDRPPA